MKVLGGAGGKVAVAHAHGAAPLAEPGRQPLRQIDGAMAAAGTADGDGEIALPLPLEARQELLETFDTAARLRKVCRLISAEPGEAGDV